MRGTLLRHVVRAVAAGAVLVLLASCTSTPPPAGPVVHISEKDFSISEPGSVAAGDVTFDVSNLGPATHEFVVVRSDLPPDQLPIGSDGLSVNEDAVQHVGEIGQVDLGTTQSLTLSLTPGNYVFFCNLDGHYLGGMHTSLVVSG
jgi:uncharacterized cupredoxin-like copper-binding protein